MRAPDHVTPMVAVRLAIIAGLKTQAYWKCVRIRPAKQRLSVCHTCSGSVTRGIFTHCTVSGFTSLQTNRNTNT
jgi:hypothetical protein